MKEATKPIPARTIGSDIKTAIQTGATREDCVAGLIYSVCMNYMNRVKGNRPVGKKIFMQGGVCYNEAVPLAMAILCGQEVIVPPEWSAVNETLLVSKHVNAVVSEWGSRYVIDVSRRGVILDFKTVLACSSHFLEGFGFIFCATCLLFEIIEGSQRASEGTGISKSCLTNFRAGETGCADGMGTLGFCNPRSCRFQQRPKLLLGRFRLLNFLAETFGLRSCIGFSR